MKKILVIVSAIAVATFSFSPAASGSHEEPIVHLRNDAWNGKVTKSLKAGLFNASTRFTKNFPAAHSSTWDRLQDGSLLCHYQSGEKAGRAFYGPHGAWRVSIEDYAGRLLPRDVTDDIRAVFGLGTEFKTVNEIIAPGRPHFYLVVIKTGSLIQRVSAGEEGVKVVETFVSDLPAAQNDNQAR